MTVVHVYCKAQRTDNSRIHRIAVVGVVGSKVFVFGQIFENSGTLDSSTDLQL